ncbi:hypothetical protein HY501_00685 [Candidatus Woesearchaeota archaeon]|nr:hypothetical protein [Candidatus Woesearchaeota archaeon]
MRKAITVVFIALLVVGVLFVAGCSTSGQAYNVPQYGGGGCGVASSDVAPVLNSVAGVLGAPAC